MVVRSNGGGLAGVKEEGISQVGFSWVEEGRGETPSRTGHGRVGQGWRAGWFPLLF